MADESSVASVPQPPSGTVTFLFTDIEGSTRLWEERPDEMRALVAEHDERFRTAIEGHGVKDVAALLDVAEGTIKSRLFEARQKLHEKLR